MRRRVAQIGGGIDRVAHRRDRAGDQHPLDALIVHDQQAFWVRRQVIHAISLTDRGVSDAHGTTKR